MIAKIFLKIIGALIILLGFFWDHAEQYPFVLKIIDKNFYYTSQALNSFYKVPSYKITKDNRAFSILCEKYFPIDECKKSSVLGRTGIYQIMGGASVGADFDLVLNPEKNALQKGVPYSSIKDKEFEEFSKKNSNQGLFITLVGIILEIL